MKKSFFSAAIMLILSAQTKAGLVRVNPAPCELGYDHYETGYGLCFTKKITDPGDLQQIIEVVQQFKTTCNGPLRFHFMDKKLSFVKCHNRQNNPISLTVK